MLKKIKEEDIVSLNELQDNLWFALGFIRGSVKQEDYPIILFLLSFQKEGHFDKLAYSENGLKEQIKDWVYQFNGKNAETYKEIFEVFEPIINKLNNGLLFELLHLIRSLNQVLLQKYFPEIFDDLIYKFSKSQGKFAGESIQPLELSRFVFDLAELPPDANIYNPFAGLASFAVFLNEEHFYLGQEINSMTWAIGSLRILAHQKPYAHFVNGDSINEWNPIVMAHLPNRKELTWQPDENGKFDLIISNPPFGQRLTTQVSDRLGGIRNCEHFLIDKGIKDLNPAGKLIAVISQGFLFHSGPEQVLRHYLIHEDLIETIILLPTNLLFSTSIQAVILVINKKKKEKGIVRFVDAKNCIKKLSKSENQLDDVELKKLLSVKYGGDSIRIVTNETISKNDYNLSVPRYFKKAFEGVELKKLLAPLRGVRNTDTIGNIIRIKDLKDDKFNYKLEVNSLDELELPGTELEISESCLLISSIGEKLKPTYFNYTGTSIYVNPNIFVFKVDVDKVDLDYLINELYAHSTVEQLGSLLVGSGMPRLRRDDFLSIKIELPEDAEQKAKIKGFKEEHIRNKEKELSLEREILGLKDEAFREFASIKHTFRQYLNALKSNVSGTRKFISNNIDKSISLNSIYSENLNRTLGEHLISLEGTIDSMSKLLASEEEPSTILEPVENDLIELIKEAQNRFSNNEIFQFEDVYFDKESFSDSGEGLIAPMVYIHPEDFFRIFSNIVSNAIEHGFKMRTNNIIRTSVSFDASNLFCDLEIANNGHPLPETFTLQHLITRGEKTSDSTGSGVGGADIKNILQKYNGTLKLRNDMNAEFPVSYLIGLPLVVYNL